MSIERARRLYRSLRDREPRRIKRIRTAPMPRAVAVMGYLAKVEYDTTQLLDGKYQAVRRFHTFAAASRAMLCSDGKRLFIVGGRFRVTSRGIVDIRPNGREES